MDNNKYNNKDNNIVQTYISYKKSFVILISGISCCGKKILAKAVQRDFGIRTNIQYINLDAFINPDFNKYITLRNEDDAIQVKDWDDIDAYDWVALDKHVNSIDKATNGIIIVGSYFPKDKIKFSYDFHIHIKLSKDEIIKKRHEYIKLHPDKFPQLTKYIDTPFESLLITKMLYPHYIEYENVTVTKHINGNNISVNLIYDLIYGYLIEQIFIYINSLNKYS